MQAFNQARSSETEDQIWLLEHPPVFTLGLAGKREHVLDPGGIPVIAADRGGQVTYHGPGQAIAYVLLDLRRLGIGAKELVRRLEQAAIDLLAGYAIAGERVAGMPGVYVGGAQIAAVGPRIARRRSDHRIAVNPDPDLAPFGPLGAFRYPG